MKKIIIKVKNFERMKEVGKMKSQEVETAEERERLRRIDRNR